LREDRIISYIFHDGTGLLVELRERRIRDPIYGYIYLSPIERVIVDSDLVQRLRSVRQLQVAHIVYPSATHTRFHHSLGVMHLGGMFAFNLIANTVAKLGFKLKELGIRDARDLFSIMEGVRLSGLLHDLGHGPFSHAFDSAVIKESKKLYEAGIYNHEVLGYKLYQIYLRDLIRQETTKINDVLDPDVVIETMDYILAPHELMGNMRGTRGIIKILRRVIRDAFFSADILDFILRDSYYTGVIEYGTVDYRRLITNAYLIPPESPWGEFEIVFSDRVRDTIRNALFSRFWLYNSVYLHKTVRLFERDLKELMGLLRPVFEQIILEAVERGHKDDFLRLTDDNLLEYFPEKYLEKDSDERKKAEEIISAIKRREKRWKLLHAEEVSLKPEIKDKVDKVLHDNKEKLKDPTELRAYYEEKERELGELIRELKERVARIIKKYHDEIREEDIWIDLPPIKFVPIISHALVEGEPVIKFITTVPKKLKETKKLKENLRNFIKEERIGELLYAWPQIITPMRIYIRKSKELERIFGRLKRAMNQFIQTKDYANLRDRIIELQYMIARLELPETA